jgi:hypothetical protein
VLAGELVAAASGLLGLGTLTVRVWVRVALARQQRRTMTAVARTLAATGRPVRARRRVCDEEWFIEVGSGDGRQESDLTR